MNIFSFTNELMLRECSSILGLHLKLHMCANESVSKLWLNCTCIFTSSGKNTGCGKVQRETNLHIAERSTKELMSKRAVLAAICQFTWAVVPQIPHQTQINSFILFCLCTGILENSFQKISSFVLNIWLIEAFLIL